jgi:hypothetical protein
MVSILYPSFTCLFLWQAKQALDQQVALVTEAVKSFKQQVAVWVCRQSRKFELSGLRELFE